MQAMLADFDPGTLTAMLVGMLVAAIVLVCLIGSGIMFVFRKQAASVALLKTTGYIFLAGLALIILTGMLGRVFHWL